MKVLKSNYINAQTENINDSIVEIEVFETVDSETHKIIYDCLRIQIFQNVEKYVLKTTSGEIVLNSSNRLSLINAYGDESKNWIGEKIKLKVNEILFKGNKVKSLEIIPLIQETIEPVLSPEPEPEPQKTKKSINKG